jgi:hypothetical protein
MSASIKEILDKIKHLYTNVPIEVVFMIFVILVGFSSFGLGRLSVMTSQQDDVKLTYNTTINMLPVNDIDGVVVASRQGTKYHYPWCSGARRISNKNKVWYKSIEDAKKTGKSPAGNCKGLR